MAAPTSGLHTTQLGSGNKNEGTPPATTQRLPISTSSRSRYVIERHPNGSYGFELRAHNGHCLLSNERDEPSLEAALALVERVRVLIDLGNAQMASTEFSRPEAALAQAFVCRQSLTGKWYFVVREPADAEGGLEQVLASSKPFDYRSRMDKALYAVRACAPGSRVVVAEG
ncbi:YegP family protein [Roseateles koreensis]|uniref:DUF1508 domain-containing protein n=1 Tax=Roseateles koreensis TaxID=2987526 RepID=A0ABT5KT50_9BURK|nr:hypothetical protein [Roseateles koreensis]MDC8786094.1 hypothetical protein [Roseateles koreensis]